MGPGLRAARVDGARVVIGAGVRLDARAHPLGRAAQAVEVRVADDGIDGADARDELGRDHLGAGPVLGLGREDEPRVAAVALVHHVIVVVDPAHEARPELLDEGQRDLLEAAARRLRGEGHVEDDDATLQVARAWELARRSEAELRPHAER